MLKSGIFFPFLYVCVALSSSSYAFFQVLIHCFSLLFIYLYFFGFRCLQFFCFLLIFNLVYVRCDRAHKHGRRSRYDFTINYERVGNIIYTHDASLLYGQFYPDHLSSAAPQTKIIGRENQRSRKCVRECFCVCAFAYVLAYFLRFIFICRWAT